MVNYVFKRYELKYILTEKQYDAAAKVICGHLCPDEYGQTTIQSLYYDTADDRIVRASLEKPVYKEKLRLRSYGLNSGDHDVFLEIKRKYNGVVYKRRISLKEPEATDILGGTVPETQIGREIGYFLSFYPPLTPKIMILYDREAWYDKSSDLRITFDRSVRFRTDALNCHTSLCGTALTSADSVLMECKTGTALPLWLTHLLCGEKIFKTSFSKYGAAYQTLHRKNNTSDMNNQGVFSYV